MRLILLTLVASVVVTLGAAAAEICVFPDGAILRAGPSRNAKALIVVPPGGEAEVVDYGRYWTIVAFGGVRGYIARAAIIRKGAYLSPLEVMSLENPGCDLGYPYSGSGRYFTGLTELRHTGLLGALLGEHVYRPC